MPKKRIKQIEEKTTGEANNANITQDGGIKKKDTGRIAIITEKGKKYGLNHKQIKFCDLYVNSNEFRGNGLRAYAEAYNLNLAKPGTYNVAKANASLLLSNENILTYLNDIIEANDLNDPFVDSQLHFLIYQNSDLQAKAQGIKIYNDLKNRIEKKLPNTAIQFNINLENSDNGTKVTINGEDKAA